MIQALNWGNQKGAPIFWEHSKLSFRRNNSILYYRTNFSNIWHLFWHCFGLNLSKKTEQIKIHFQKVESYAYFSLIFFVFPYFPRTKTNLLYNYFKFTELSIKIILLIIFTIICSQTLHVILLSPMLLIFSSICHYWRIFWQKWLKLIYFME